MDLKHRLQQLVELEFELVNEDQMLMEMGQKYSKRKFYKETRQDFDKQFKEGQPIWWLEPHEYLQEQGLPEGLVKGNEVIEVDSKEGLCTHVWVRKKIAKRVDQFHAQTKINYIELDPKKYKKKPAPEQHTSNYKRLLEAISAIPKRKHARKQ